jgi:hypothetical protein
MNWCPAGGTDHRGGEVIADCSRRCERRMTGCNRGFIMTVTTRIFEALSLGLMLSTGPMLWSTPTCAKGTGFVFVSSEKLNNVDAIDPKQDDRVIKWIETSRSPREMKFRNVRKQQLLVACGDDAAIDVGTLAVIDHVPPDANPEFLSSAWTTRRFTYPTRQDPGFR